MASKELERGYLKRFAEARPDLQITDAEDSESQDFLITRDRHLIGIEVTRYSPPRRPDGFIAEEQERVMGHDHGQRAGAV